MVNKELTTKFNTIDLREDWKIQSSKNISQNGKLLSSNSANTNDWLPAQVPSTILGNLVENKIYEDPYFGENLKSIPTDIFKIPWWYTTTFTLDENQENICARLNFDGINYKANVWLNGIQIATSDTINGAYKRTSFDISIAINPGKNFLAIEVTPPKAGDFSTGFVDWNPAPPDGNMGIFRPVTLEIHGGVLIQNPFIQTKVDLETLKKASLTISAELKNESQDEISGFLTGKIETYEFSKKVNLKPNSKKTVVFSPEDFPQLKFINPRLWWPFQLGNPDLYELQLTFKTASFISDYKTTTFGIREIEDYWLNDIHRGYKVNGHKVLIKGAGWTDDLFLMDTDESIEAQVKYVKQMNLNCIRLEGFWGKDQKLYDLCDEHGLLLMVGWSCHWEHEIHMGVPVSERYGAVYKTEDVNHVAQAWEDQLIWLRNHPSIFVWTVASDKVPITILEEKYIATFAKYDSTRPYLNSTGGVGSDQHVIGSEDVISEISGCSGVKMLGPYAYTAPVYWFTDTNFGGAYGFNTETGPGVQVPQIESLKKMFPEKDLWPISESWNYHCGRYEFSDIHRFTDALNARYGEPNTLEDFDKKAQAMNYELMRPMFEAFQVNKKKSTGIIQWMLNAAWPKMYWQLYDHYLMPTGAFYATQKACLPLHLIYNYGDKNIYAINDYAYAIDKLSALIRIYDVQSNLIFEKTIVYKAAADSSVSLFSIENLENISTVYFVDLRLTDTNDKQLSTNFYWLSTQEEVLDYEADLGEFAYHTPSKEYADLNLLNELPTAAVSVSTDFIKEGKEQQAIVTLKNTSDSIAFLINLKLIDNENKDPILPVFWEDNFISLLAGETRIIKANFDLNVNAELKIEGWNLKQ